MILLLLACVSSDRAGTAVHDSAEDADSGAGEDSGVDSALDSGPGDDTGAVFACPAGMAGVPTEAPSYCIDAYEVAVLDDGTLVSAAGMEPKVGYSYEEAVAACEASAAVDADGVAYATKRLATAREWEDAGDGVVGEGGTPFPWGETFDETLCVTLSATGQPQFEGTQPTGSMPACVSVFGLYDQVGNAWEWTDSGIRIDTDAALAVLLAEGVVLAEGEDDALLLVGGASDALVLDVAGLQPAGFTVTAEGFLEVEASQIQPALDEFFARGYARAPELHDTPLPIWLVSTDPADPAARCAPATAREYDGRALPDKRGCAWYTGTGGACMLATASYSHLPDFDGTIGFRCVAPPYLQ